MFLNATVLKSEVEEDIQYNKQTRAEIHNFWVNMTVLDDDTYDVYLIQLREGHAGVEELIKSRQQNASIDKLHEIANRLKDELPQKQEKVKLEVIEIKPQPYLKLICRLLQEKPTQNNETENRE